MGSLSEAGRTYFLLPHQSSIVNDADLVSLVRFGLDWQSVQQV